MAAAASHQQQQEQQRRQLDVVDNGDLLRPSITYRPAGAPATQPTPGINGININLPSKTNSPVPPPSTMPPISTPPPTFTTPVTPKPTTTETRPPNNNNNPSIPGAEATATRPPSYTANNNNNQPSSNAVVVADADCVANIEFADWNGDGNLNRQEFVVLVNVMADEMIASNFDTLPQNLQAQFNIMADSANQQIVMEIPTMQRRRQLNNNNNVFASRQGNAPVSYGTICDTVQKGLAGETTVTTPAPTPPATTPMPTPQTTTATPQTTQVPTAIPQLTPRPTPPSTPTDPSSPLPNDSVTAACATALAFADFDMNGALTENEFVTFCNVFGDTLVATNFQDLPQKLQDIFSNSRGLDLGGGGDIIVMNDAVIQFCQDVHTGLLTINNDQRGSDLEETDLFSSTVPSTVPSETPSTTPSTTPSVVPSKPPVFAPIAVLDMTTPIIVVLDTTPPPPSQPENSRVALILGVTIGSISLLVLMAIGVYLVLLMRTNKQRVVDTAAPKSDDTAGNQN
ncbi:expressed unknown protein [Seminavis robusta]|uniref:EF-hand domain-containing protein n=1 Tax=Seminavis robusta TaxID=568900 RepID=A0A9N8HY54_9STRA|nr:expressed unknown protein [Seminavis robusta]|eukprot:Sro2394_g325890.1 n/a (513) ;mRNA; r:6183-7721